MSYKVSKDYPRLKQLLDEGHKVVCWLTYDWSRGDGHAEDARKQAIEQLEAELKRLKEM